MKKTLLLIASALLSALLFLALTLAEYSFSTAEKGTCRGCRADNRTCTGTQSCNIHNRFPGGMKNLP